VVYSIVERMGMISVIIVSYEVPDLLLRCIESLENTASDGLIEIIIVDNHSRDNGRKLVKKRYPCIQWIQNSSNLGFAAAVNIGLQAASGDYFLLLNPDTEIKRKAIISLSEFWNSHPEAGIVGGKIINSDGSFQKQCRRQFPRPASAFFRLFGLSRWFPKHRLTSLYELDIDNIEETHEIDAVSGAFMSFTRVLMSDIGMFDEGYFLMGEDLDYCYRAKNAGFKVYYFPDANVVHHHGASRRTRPLRSIYYGHYAMFRYYKKFLQTNYSPITTSLVYIGILSHLMILSTISAMTIMVKGFKS
ncbi:glycosyltransferase family 2 protein, partial [bacterium]|nr:glycosyltransferase family 2 protein [bacterium]